MKRRMITIVAAACAIMGGAIMFYYAGRHADGWLLGGVAVGILVGSTIRSVRGCLK